MHQADVIKLQDIPCYPIDLFRTFILNEVKKGSRILSLFGMPCSSQKVRLMAVIGNDKQGAISCILTEVGESYPSLTPDCPQAHWFEREIKEQWGIEPKAHPWLKPIRFSPAYRMQKHIDQNTKILPSVTDFFQMQGEAIHEVAVGPVHAGIIEPGHFRFQCYGEHVFHLEISLGYQHRGVEQALCGGPAHRTIHYIETLAGDTTVGHALAYSQAMEALGKCNISFQAKLVRGIGLELERLANHTGDLGALANDVGYLPTASYCGRLRGDFLNMTALLCGNRFGRGLVRPGGTGYELDEQIREELLKRIDVTYRDVKDAVMLLWNTSSVMERFEGTGKITSHLAESLGLVGVAARACGLNRDVRFDYPSGISRFVQIPVASCPHGDVFARAYVRWLEIQRSVDCLRTLLKSVKEIEPQRTPTMLDSEACTVSLVEGWRGEICHVAITDREGTFFHYKIVDPSFHNWIGLAMAMREGQISDFPLCNKSFNLSYCGHDL